MAMTRAEAKMVAQELHRLLHKDIEKAVHAHIEDVSDTYIGVQEAAEMLKLSPSTIYNNRARLPCSKVGGRLLFSTNALKEIIRTGRRI